MPPRANQRLAHLHRVLDHFVDLDRGLLQYDPAAQDPRDIQQIIHQPCEMSGLSFDDGPRPFELRLVWRMHAQYLRRIADRCERIAQLVCQHGQEFILALIDVLQRLFGLSAGRDIETDTNQEVPLALTNHTGPAIDPTQSAAWMLVAKLGLTRALSPASGDQGWQRSGIA